jgi:hypothetical protein
MILLVQHLVEVNEDGVLPKITEERYHADRIPASDWHFCLSSDDQIGRNHSLIHHGIEE